jgi:hypothetical protein
MAWTRPEAMMRTKSRTPRSRRAVGLCAVCVTLLLCAPVQAALPKPDAVFYGSVTIAGVPATSGFVIRASLPSGVIASYTIGESAAAGGSYVLRIPMQQQTSAGEPPPGGFAFDGTTATLSVGTANATTAVLNGGSVTQLNLAVADAGPVPPTLTPTPLVPPTSTPTSTPIGGILTRTPTSRTATPTRTGSRGPTPTVTPTGPTATPTPTGTPGLCAGDCDGSGEVTINELITLVNLALENSQVSACQPGDVNGDQTITINEIISAVTKALAGCTGG